MSQVTITKKDIIWSYIAIFFQVGSGIIVLPFVLRMLSADEVGYNYVMLTVLQILFLFDNGFSPMFGKNLTYVFCGAKQLQKEGVSECKSEDIDYHLLATVISVGKMVYFRMSWIILVIMLTGGTWYVYYVTQQFTLVKNALWIWLIFCASAYFNVYYGYLGAFMNGRGYVMEAKKATIFSRLTYIGISVALLYCNLGLISLAIANFVAPFVTRIMCLSKFYDPELKGNLKNEKISKSERKETFLIIWHNAKKMCITAVGAYCVNRVSLFLAGIFLPLVTVGSYGLMLQLGGIINSLSVNYFNTEQPKMASFKVRGEEDKLRNEFSIGLITFFVLIISGFALMIVLGPWLLRVIKSQTLLPSLSVMIIYAVVTVLEANHSLCAALLVVGNRVPPIACSLIPGFAILILSWIVLDFFHWGLLALVIIPGICQAAYNNWKWPYEALKELKMNPFQVMDTGFRDLYLKMKLALR